MSICLPQFWMVVTGSSVFDGCALASLLNFNLILGAQCLSQFGDVVMNFEKLYELQRSPTPSITPFTTLQRMDKLLTKGTQIVVDLCGIPVALNVQEPVLQFSSSSQANITPLMDEFANIFVESIHQPPRRAIDHAINLHQGSVPIANHPYHYPNLQKLEIEKIVNAILRNGIIQPSTSTFSASIVLVKKEDVTWRMCIDYRKLNANTIWHKFLIPLVKEFLDELHGATIFSKLHLRSRYHQIQMRTEDVHKPAFQTHESWYKFCVMPFRFTNASYLSKLDERCSSHSYRSSAWYFLTTYS